MLGFELSIITLLWFLTQMGYAMNEMEKLYQEYKAVIQSLTDGEYALPGDLLGHLKIRRMFDLGCLMCLDAISNRVRDRWFRCTNKDLAEFRGMFSGDKVRAIQHLIRAGYIETTVEGKPPTRLVRIDYVKIDRDSQERRQKRFAEDIRHEQEGERLKRNKNKSGVY